MDDIIAVVNRGNQRGGRMLSIIDLVEAGTFTIKQACWLLRQIENGSSWLVGANPGGAGKTTIMGALIAMLPQKATITLTNRGSGWRRCSKGDGVVSYELSPGFYDAYIWGDELVTFTELGLKGCRIISNLHADTLDEARDQIVRQNGATDEGFMAFDIFIPIVLKRKQRMSVSAGCGFRTPTVEKIYTASGGSWRVVDTSRSRPEGHQKPDSPASNREREIEMYIEKCLKRGIRKVEDVRRAWLSG